MATAIFYASSTGNTKEAAQIISDCLNNIEIFDISEHNVELIKEYDKIILGISTWGEGDLQDDWEDAMDQFCDIDFSTKTVALFGLGDQESYADCFLDAMGIIYEQIVKTGDNIIGQWDTEGYYFDESKAVLEGKFVGLAIDEDNQSELTDERIKMWCDEIKDRIL